MFEQWMGGRQETFEPFFALGRITADTVESIARRNQEIASDCFDLGVSHLKALTAGHDVAELGAEEMRLVNAFGEKMKTHADAFVRIAADAGEAYSAWTASFVETAKQNAAPKATVAKAGVTKKASKRS
jgi:hypothetical protein